MLVERSVLDDEDWGLVLGVLVGAPEALGDEGCEEESEALVVVDVLDDEGDEGDEGGGESSLI